MVSLKLILECNLLLLQGILETQTENAMSCDNDSVYQTFSGEIIYHIMITFVVSCCIKVFSKSWFGFKKVQPKQRPTHDLDNKNILIYTQLQKKRNTYMYLL